MKNLIRLLSALFICLLAAIKPAHADGIMLPARFTRIASVSELKAGEFYAIGGEGIGTGSALQFALLSNRKKGSSTLKGIIRQKSQALTIDDPGVVWQLEAQVADGQYSIVNAENGTRLHVTKAGTAGLEASSKGKTTWRISAGDNGFRIQSTGESERYLGINGGEEPYFGNYTEIGADCCDLYIYRMERLLSQQEGEATLPADGSAVVLCTNGYLRDTEGNARSADGYVTGNGRITPDAGGEIWTAEHVGTGARFALKNAEGLYLDYSLHPATERTIWNVDRGHIVTTETTPRYLCFLDRFGIYSAEETEGAVDVQLLPVGEAPGMHTDNGVGILSGTWSTPQLRQIDWSGLTAVDATNISLPRPLTSLDSRPGDSNTILYVSADDSSVIPKEWPFVATDDGNIGSARLIRTAVLHDRKPLVIDREIDFEAGQVTYRREPPADDLWSTLCLPFEAQVPEGYLAERLESVEGHELIFVRATNIEAGHAVIIRATGNTAKPLELKARTNGTLTPSTPTDATKALCGIYKDIDITAANENRYFLNSDGTQFVRAAAGSHLSPFRAYLQFNTSGNIYGIRHRDNTTGLNDVQQHDNAPESAYNLGGLSVGHLKQGKALHYWQPGIYIVEGQKIIIPQAATH